MTKHSIGVIGTFALVIAVALSGCSRKPDSEPTVTAVDETAGQAAENTKETGEMSEKSGPSMP